MPTGEHEQQQRPTSQAPWCLGTCPIDIVDRHLCIANTVIRCLPGPRLPNETSRTPFRFLSTPTLPHPHRHLTDIGPKHKRRSEGRKAVADAHAHRTGLGSSQLCPCQRSIIRAQTKWGRCGTGRLAYSDSAVSERVVARASWRVRRAS